MIKKEFIELLTTIENLYPGRFKSDDLTAKTWWEILKNHEFEHCKKNLFKHTEENEWPPSIANIVKREKDSSRAYNQGLSETIDSIKPYDQIIKEIEQRTGRKVIE